METIFRTLRTVRTDFSVYPHIRARVHTHGAYTKKASEVSEVSVDADELEAIRWLERHERSLNRKRREVD